MDLADIPATDDPRLGDVFRVLHQLRSHLDEAGFRRIYQAGYAEGLRFTGGFEGTRCVAVAGWRIINCTSHLRRLHIDDLVTDAAVRSRGYGRALIDDLVGRARAEGCTAVTLDSGVQRFAAHRFYLRERMDIVAHHFSLSIT